MERSRLALVVPLGRTAYPIALQTSAATTTLELDSFNSRISCFYFMVVALDGGVVLGCQSFQLADGLGETGQDAVQCSMNKKRAEESQRGKGSGRSPAISKNERNRIRSAARHLEKAVGKEGMTPENRKAWDSAKGRVGRLVRLNHAEGRRLSQRLDALLQAAPLAHRVDNQ